MKKFGFTLAEVLITLGIIGVVAALTAPALVKNTGSAKIGPSLAKFVNTFETATESMMNDENVDKLSDLTSSSDDFAEQLSKYIIMTPIKTASITSTSPYKLYSPDGTDQGALDCTTYQLKDGSYVFFTWGSVANMKGKGPYKGIVGRAYVDINGIAGNNKSGKEFFAFYIDNSGVLVPFGSNAEQYLKGSKSSCYHTTGTTALSGYGCTGVIADNGWKADY